MTYLVDDIFQLSPTVLGQLQQWFAQNPPIIPAAAVQGLPRTVTGLVNSDASIAAGSGFAVAHSGTGVYSVSLTVAFQADPTINVTIAADQQMLAPVVSAEDNTSFTVKLHDSFGSAADCAFSFTARPTL